MLSAQVDRHRLRAVREERELTTSQVAALLSSELGRKVSQSTITRYETGTRQPSPKMFGALCRLYRVQKNELLIPNEVTASVRNRRETPDGPADAAPGTKGSEPTASAAAAPSSGADL